MLEPGNIIDIDESRKPFNTYMRLSLDLLQIILPVIQPELMKGLIDNDNDDIVMLHLNLAQEKIKQVRQISKSFENHHNVLIK